MDDERAPIGLFSASTLTVVSLGCVGMIEYSLVMPSLNEYVTEQLHGSNFFYGMSMAAFSAARVCFMPVLGTWSDRRPMIEPFMFSIMLALCGNVMYATAQWANSCWFVLIGRALIGMGAANTTLSMSYITRITTSETRTKALATLNGVNLIGIVMGPATNLLINFTIKTPIDGLVLNKFTNPGWFMFLVLVVVLILMGCFFQEPAKIQGNQVERRESFAEMEQASLILADDGLDQPLITSSESWQKMFLRLLIKESLWVHFVISFVSNFILAELETAMPKLTNVDFGWSTLENSAMYAVIGVLTAITLVSTGILSKHHSDRTFILVGTVLYGIALLIACLTMRKNPSLTVFIIVCSLLVVASPITDSPNLAFYSKRLQSHPDAIPYLGLFIGFIQASNAVSRTIAPLYAGWALGDTSDQLKIYLGPAIIWGFSAVVLLFKYRTLKEVVSSVPDRWGTLRRQSSVLQSPMLTISAPGAVSP
uniref:Major facilitator superfamily (MFS) profile domain-containing protein n=1 Tax=Mucochytrium quahogii TaxID=96639 RepID=A0A7S2W7R3_9STRA|mmetsp:Transcript_17442/g.28159  ORF Transcript_17442/g.28159 Transcript_17442/m.28159 type:complete len:481 (+) Transcript_17442:251-1693(+)|eukprot:CAMPEP_0203759716 /NCGR_PEP_ID=MMETSP0098-20131031/12846_1 /ASSEMBLY_ACC=CAM_ASM_000208 /TAXON_ID=96639 /ORGANISM=" , Strain NY0313808BC1" /LENGTH=480 /DNA_ID=CAMNT_0050652865 /DNA_START=245 /DNA_END=1687 /DNA_ORIENTATION=+